MLLNTGTGWVRIGPGYGSFALYPTLMVSAFVVNLMDFVSDLLCMQQLGRNGWTGVWFSRQAFSGC